MNDETAIVESKYMRLRDLYPTDPSEREQFWEFFSEGDFEKRFKLIEIDPVVVYKTWTDEGVIIRDAHKELGVNDKFKIKLLRKFKGLPSMILLVYGETIVDGYHRLAAMSRNGLRSARALDLSQRE